MAEEEGATLEVAPSDVTQEKAPRTPNFQFKDEEIPECRRPVIIAMKHVFANYSQFDEHDPDHAGIADDHFCTEVLKAGYPEVKEYVVNEYLDFVEYDLNISYDALVKGVEDYVAILRSVFNNLEEAIDQLYKKLGEEGWSDLMREVLQKQRDAFVKAARKDDGESRRQCANKHSDVLVIELINQLKNSDKSNEEAKEKMFMDILKTLTETKETVLKSIVSLFKYLEHDFVSLISDVEREGDLNALWDEADHNNSGNVVMFELNALIRKKFPLLSSPRANQQAYAASCSGGEITRKQFPILLRNMVYFNKVHTVFEEMDHDGSKHIDLEEFTASLERLELEVPPDDVETEFQKAAGDDARINFNEFIIWCSESEYTGLRDLAYSTLPEGGELITNKKEDDDSIAFAHLYTEVTTLLKAIQTKDVDVVAKLIYKKPLNERVAYVNQIDTKGNSVIFSALEPEHEKIVSLLLDYGADPGYHNNNRDTPLHLVCLRNPGQYTKKIVKLLLMHGATIDAENSGYNKPHQMCKNDHQKQIIQALLNTTYETCKADFKEKRVLPCDADQRCFARSLFDIVDDQHIGYVRVQDIFPLLSIVIGDEEISPDPEWVLQFFGSIDTDHTATISFEKWLFSVTSYLVSKDTSKGKGKKGKKGKKGSKKGKNAFGK